jgi:GAF domain-containing protein
MSESLTLPDSTQREDIYLALLPQLHALCETESDAIANLANIAAVLKEAFGFFWVGFYRVEGQELVLGPFQGPLACTRIAKGKGVCGAAWDQGKTLVIEDVDQFPGHIACSSASRSEIVVPFTKNGKVVLLLDVDSDQTDDFSQLDQKHLEQLQTIIEKFI